MISRQHNDGRWTLVGLCVPHWQLAMQDYLERESDLITERW